MSGHLGRCLFRARHAGTLACALAAARAAMAEPSCPLVWRLPSCLRCSDRALGKYNVAAATATAEERAARAGTSFCGATCGRPPSRALLQLWGAEIEEVQR